MRVHPHYLSNPIERQQRSPDLGLVLIERRPPVSPKPKADQLAHGTLHLMTGGCTSGRLTVTLQNGTLRYAW